MDTPQLYADLLPSARRRILVVDDDPTLRLLLRETLAADEFELEEVASAEEAQDVARFWRPSVLLLDVSLPGLDGLSFCRQLTKGDPESEPMVILLTGSGMTQVEARSAGARALLRKPFSPLDLIGLLDHLGNGSTEFPFEQSEGDAAQLLIYARDLSRIVDVERTQRRLLQQAYRQTVAALADALEAKDPGTGLHAQRVQHYAITLTEVVARSLLDDPSLEYGFVLHDVGKIGIPDQILRKPGKLTSAEFDIVKQHVALGDMIVRDLPDLDQVRAGIRHHHERWDGDGYLERLEGEDIPHIARILAVADAFSAMTTTRPYRKALDVREALTRLGDAAGTQLEERLVVAFVDGMETAADAPIPGTEAPGTLWTPGRLVA
jgi:response regulator RpfG family c-di-GMP phosphodiesterase